MHQFAKVPPVTGKSSFLFATFSDRLGSGLSVLGSCDSPLNLLFQIHVCHSCSGHWGFPGSPGPHAIHISNFWRVDGGVRWGPVLALSGRVLSRLEASFELAELGDLLSTQEVLLQRDSFHK